MSTISKTVTSCFALLFLAAAPFSMADDKDTRSEAQRTFDRNMENANKVHQREQEAKKREEMRDKTHDGRLKTGKDTSVSADKNGVNVRTTTK
ncbi:hypothetical protein ABIC83_002808 [Roseateles asaccharophilus]|uniref:hypothetical protein n=1 Tax=Roseateles asaccharophilus TaxID=582607 RepID=UPI0038369CF6